MKTRVLAIVSFICAATLSLAASPLAAQDCASDEDCPKNYACEVVGGSDCAYACPDGNPCTLPDDCVAEEIKGCVAQPCTDDSQCEEGMVCHSYTYDECSGGSGVDCLPEEQCLEPEPVQCETVTESRCVPSYQAPCEQSADCGEGFDCVERMDCRCSGGGTGGASGGGEVPVDSDEADGGAAEPASGDFGTDPSPVPDPELPSSSEEVPCECAPSGDFYCKMHEISCETEAECPEGWTCEPTAYGTATCAAPAEGETDPLCNQEPTVLAKACMPPFSDLGGYGGMWETWGGGTTLLGADTGRSEAASDGVLGGEEQNAYDDVPGEAPAGVTATGEESAESSGGGDQGGCSVGEAGAGNGGSALGLIAGLLGLTVLRRRRRG